MSKNKITTCSYFIKRLRDSGYVVDKLFGEYSFSDPRSWSVIVDPTVASVIITWYNNHNDLGEEYFEMHVPLKTSSWKRAEGFCSNIKFFISFAKPTKYFVCSVNKASTYAAA